VELNYEILFKNTSLFNDSATYLGSNVLVFKVERRNMKKQIEFQPMGRFIRADREINERLDKIEKWIAHVKTCDCTCHNRGVLECSNCQSVHRRFDIPTVVKMDEESMSGKEVTVLLNGKTYIAVIK
jgi:hypothetical protein